MAFGREVQHDQLERISRSTLPPVFKLIAQIGVKLLNALEEGTGLPLITGFQPELRQNAIGVNTVRQSAQHLRSHPPGLHLLMALPQDIGQQHLQIQTLRVAGDGLFKFRNRLREQLPPGVQPGQRAAGQADLAGGLEPSQRVEPLDLFL